MRTTALVFGLVFILAATGIGQVRTVTNATLEKFQQQRLAAERDYRDNYERLGFPSPEELERQREEDMAARIQLAEQLRHARLEKERLELEQRSLDLETARLNAEVEVEHYDRGSFGGYYLGGFGVGGFNHRFGRGKSWRHFPPFGFRTPVGRAGGYRATPFGVIPTPRTPAPRPILRRR